MTDGDNFNSGVITLERKRQNNETGSEKRRAGYRSWSIMI
jgi:hypothetical protein